MIVPAMTLQQILNELLEDYQSVKRRAGVQSDVLQNQLKRKHGHHETHAMKYKTGNKNEWSILMRIFPHQTQQLYYLESEDKYGKVAYQLDFYSGDKQPGIVKYNPHFFKRYRERQEIALTHPSEIVRHFFRHNMDRQVGQTEQNDDGTRFVNYVFTEGVGIGWIDLPSKIAVLKTYLPHHMLNNKQQRLADFITGTDDWEEFLNKLLE